MIVHTSDKNTTTCKFDVKYTLNNDENTFSSTNVVSVGETMLLIWLDIKTFF